MSKSPSLRRIQADVRELAIDPSPRYHAAPLEDDMFEWHFTIRGAEGTDFEGGIYHGRILLPPEYPFKPPHIMLLTPSGRFETNTKICLSFSAFHPELWQPAWGIRLILEALISFLPTPADGAVGALNWTPDERKRLAQKSVSYCCPRCGHVVALLPEPMEDEEDERKPARFAKEIEQLVQLQAASHKEEDITSSKESNENAKEEEAPSVEETTTNETETAAAAASEEAPTSTQVDDAASEAREETEPAIPPVPDMVRQQQHEVAPEPVNISSWLSDNVLNVIIVVCAALCYLLYHKAIVLYSEIQSLNHISH